MSDVLVANKIQELISVVNRRFSSRKLWEYKVYLRPADQYAEELEKDLNNLAKEYWQVVKIEETMIFLKREL